jgi:hypothetical protein
MARRFGFKPKLRDAMRMSLQAQRIMAWCAPPEKAEIAAAHLAMAEAIKTAQQHHQSAELRTKAFFLHSCGQLSAGVGVAVVSD